MKRVGDGVGRLASSRVSIPSLGSHEFAVERVLEPGDIEVPGNPHRWFGRAAPLDVEIGFGSGRFLTSLADDREGANVLGVEVSAGSLARGLRKLRHEGADHVRLFKGDAAFLYAHVLPDESVRETWVNFPSPWPKERHADRRLMDEAFFGVVAARLVSSGRLYLTSDHDDYFERAVAAARSVEALDVELREPPDSVLETKYAKKAADAGRAIDHAVVERVGEPTHSPERLETYETMHHAVVRGEIPVIDSFDKQVRRLDEGVVVVLDAYRPVGDEGLVLPVHAEMEDLTQRFLVEIDPRDDGDVKVEVSSFNKPLMTEATSAAVDLVTEWLVDQDEGNEVEERLY